MERPDGIILTISQAMLKEKGLRNWLRNFFDAMGKSEWTYWFRQGNKPKYEVMYVYLCIGGYIRYRINCVGYHGPSTLRFDDGKEMYAHAWICTTGPLTRAPYRIPRKGFQGFRYTQKIF